MKVVQKSINKSKFSDLALETLVVNKILLFDIFIKRQNDYVIIIEAGTLLTPRLYKMLEAKGQLYISRADLNKDKLTHQNLFKLIQHNKNNFQNSITLLYEMNSQVYNDFLASTEDFLDVDALRSIAQSIIYLVKENDNYIKESMHHFSIEYILPNHSLHVAIYAIHLGYHLHLEEKELIQLGVASLLHDVGHKKIDSSLLNKQSQFTEKELQEVQQHPKYSSDIAKKNSINDPYILNAILHHHESHDGLGYPSNAPSEEISNFSSIINISDVFDALTNDRAHRKKHSSYEAFTLMLKEESMAHKFHKKYLDTFLQSFR
jgi:HD-GYP domain-containing protein (c-di-GMP phosphodiesterase class II)